jgi:hypothetical protein
MLIIRKYNNNYFQISRNVKANDIEIQGNQGDEFHRQLQKGGKGFGKGSQKGVSDTVTPSYILTELVGQPQPFNGQEPSITFDNQLFQLFPSPLLNNVQSYTASCVLVNAGVRKYLCNIVVSFDVVTDFFPPSQIMASGPVIFPVGSLAANQPLGNRQFPPLAITGGTGIFVGSEGTMVISSNNNNNFMNANGGTSQRRVNIFLT